MNRIWTNRGCMDLLYMYWVYILYMYRLQTWDVIWALIFMHTNEMDGSFSGDSVVCNYARTTVLYREGARSLLFEQNRSNIHACHGDQSRVAREQYIPLCRTPFIQYATSNKMLQSLLLLWIWHVDDSICVVIEHTLIRCMQFSLISMCHSCQVCKMVFFFFLLLFLASTQLTLHAWRVLQAGYSTACISFISNVCSPMHLHIYIQYTSASEWHSDWDSIANLNKHSRRDTKT